MEPAHQLIALRRRRPLDPLEPPDRRARGARQDEPPPRQPPLLRVGVEQRERQHAACEHGGQSPTGLFHHGSDRALAVGEVDDANSAELMRGVRCRRGDGAGGARAGVLAGAMAGAGSGGAEPARSGRAAKAEGGGDRAPLARAPSSHRHHRDSGAAAEQEDCHQCTAGGRRRVEDHDRGDGGKAENAHLARPQRPEDAAPLERAEPVREPLVVHSGPSAGGWAGGRGSGSSVAGPRSAPTAGFRCSRSP